MKYVAVLMAIAMAAAPVFLADQFVEAKQAGVEMEAFVETEAVEGTDAAIETEADEETETVEDIEAVTEQVAVTQPIAAVGAEAVGVASVEGGDWPFAGVAPGSVAVFYGESPQNVGTIVVKPAESVPAETPVDALVGQEGEEAAEAEEPDERIGAEEPVEPDERIGVEEPVEPEETIGAEEPVEPDERIGVEEPVEPDETTGAEEPVEPDANAPFDASAWAERFNEGWGNAPESAFAFEMLGGEESGGYRDYVAGWLDESIVVEVYESVEANQLWTAVTLYEEGVPPGDESAYMDSFTDAVLSCVRAKGVKLDAQSSEGIGRYIRGVIDGMRASGGEAGLQEFVYNGMFFSIGYDAKTKVADCYIIF